MSTIFAQKRKMWHELGCILTPNPRHMNSLNQLFQLTKYIAGYFTCFDRRTYASFKAIVMTLLLFRHQKQADCAALAKKSVSAIQYFFHRAKWDVDRLNMTRLKILRGRTQTVDRETDLLVLDGCPFAKDKDCKSEEVSWIFDNRKKQVVNGYEGFGAAVVSRDVTYPLALTIFRAGRWKSQWQAWVSFLNWCLLHTKAKLVIVDRGFRNGYFLKTILEASRHFLIRGSLTMPLWVMIKKPTVKSKKRGRKQRFPERERMSLHNLIKRKHSIRTQRGSVWFVTDVIVDAWKNQVETPCSIVVFHQNGFREPMVLVHSEGNIATQKAFELIQAYHRRWKIEHLFLELKSYFQWEKFRLGTIKAISRYLVVCMVAHGILQAKQSSLDHGSLLWKFIASFLKKRRNIKKQKGKSLFEITLQALKIFFESSVSTLYDLTSDFHLFLNQKPCFTS